MLSSRNLNRLPGPDPGSSDPGSGSRCNDPGSGCEDPGSGCEDPGSDCEDPDEKNTEEHYIVNKYSLTPVNFTKVLCQWKLLE